MPYLLATSDSGIDRLCTVPTGAATVSRVVAIAAYLTGVACELLPKRSRVFANYRGPQRKSNMCTETRKAR